MVVVLILVDAGIHLFGLLLGPAEKVLCGAAFDGVLLALRLLFGRLFVRALVYQNVVVCPCVALSVILAALKDRVDLLEVVEILVQVFVVPHDDLLVQLEEIEVLLRLGRGLLRAPLFVLAPCATEVFSDQDVLFWPALEVLAALQAVVVHGRGLVVGQYFVRAVFFLRPLKLDLLLGIVVFVEYHRHSSLLLLSNLLLQVMNVFLHSLELLGGLVGREDFRLLLRPTLRSVDSLVKLRQRLVVALNSVVLKNV